MLSHPSYNVVDAVLPLAVLPIMWEMLSYHNVGDAVCGRCCLTTPIMWEMLSVCLTNNVGDAVCLTPIMWEMLSHHSYNVGDAVLPLR